MTVEQYMAERLLRAQKNSRSYWGRRSAPAVRQVDLAKMWGVRQSAVSKKLRGQAALRIDEMVVLAKALELDIVKLLEEAISAVEEQSREV